MKSNGQPAPLWKTTHIGGVGRWLNQLAGSALGTHANLFHHIRALGAARPFGAASDPVNPLRLPVPSPDVSADSNGHEATLTASLEQKGLEIEALHARVRELEEQQHSLRQRLLVKAHVIDGFRRKTTWARTFAKAP